jgi:hypothetical protein
MVLRDAAGLVVDSLNYGLLVDPWAAEGYQAVSGAGQSGCRVTAPGTGGRGGPSTGSGQAGGAVLDRSAGRFPDGRDTDSNCNDFLLQAATTLPAASGAGATNIKVASVTDFVAGQTIMIDTDASLETVVIATVGTAGATTIGAAIDAGATVIPWRALQVLAPVSRSRLTVARRVRRQSSFPPPAAAEAAALRQRPQSPSQRRSSCRTRLAHRSQVPALLSLRR